ncbi:MAG: hypothetical protein DWH91_03530 [Planctomycetota bacterium]|nr:MAG: hypothetical protein DWH91_03530 [Planctomycetota bacterium]
MTTWQWMILGLFSAIALLAAAVLMALRQRNMQNWVRGYYFPSEQPAPVDDEQPIDLFLSICDHYEPECYGATHEQALARVQRWVVEYPRLFDGYRDFNGRPPQHTFFYPQDEYRPEYLDLLAPLCASGYGDVDIHLHHDHDTAERFREKLIQFRDVLFHRHGLLRRDPLTDEIVYGFIHGNWALCNSRPDGRWCGVDQELTILKETGCYADFTLPSAPSQCQTSTINSIYYAKDIPGQRKSHDQGIRSRAGQTAPADHLLMIQGPLSLDWQSRKFGVIPRIENADIHEGRPPAWRRFQQWMNVGVHVADRPNWKFIKLHTHGCKDGNIDTLLGPEMQAFHASLAAQMQADPRYRLHYVTAWEMALLVRQAESGAQNPSLTSSTRFRLEPGGITPHRDRPDGRRKSDGSPRVVTR